MKKLEVKKNRITLECFDEPIDKDDIKYIEDQMAAVVLRYGRVQFLIMLGQHEKATLGAQWELVKVAFKSDPHIDKIAVVSDRKSDKWLAALDNIIVPWEEKYFNVDKLQAAHDWLDHEE